MVISQKAFTTVGGEGSKAGLAQPRAVASHQQPIPASGEITELFESVTEPVILGESRTGDRFTLMDCEAVVAAYPIGETREEEWRPRVGLLGEHLEQEEDRRFETITCEFDYLPDWIRRTDVGYRFGDPKDHREVDR